ncbi:hypothetical protein DFH09DRAFT_1359690 [Mycena vulgaris]|nr:hypothetical protein DFH09DRAFT_1359690 [Mycena vulgaris]
MLKDIIPHDVLIRIMSYTGVLDIITLRQVCKSLLTASYQRVVWIQALRALCAERNIFLSSFPIPEMTLPQLEHSTTASHRFLARMRHDFKTGTLRPFSTRLLSSLASATEGFKNMVLVPGGRFLLTSCRRNVRLWDLGFHSGAVIAPSPISSVDVGLTSISRIATIQSSTNHQEILVLVISRQSSNAGFLNVYRLSPSAGKPQFSLLAAAAVSDGYLELRSFSESRTSVSDNEFILTWNFIQDTWVRWGDEMGDDVHQVSICNNTLVALTSDNGSSGITLLKLPSNSRDWTILS